MKHILFPTVADADAFIADLQNRGAVKPEIGSTTLNRRAAGDYGTTVPSTSTDYDPDLNSGPSGTAEDAGAGAVKGTVAGLVSGAAIGAIGTATGLIGAAAATTATVATGGLALPVILGLAALGSGVGAAVGGIGGASGVDETGDTHSSYATSTDVDDDHYDRIDAGVSAGGRAVAVDEHVPQDVLEEAMQAHGGHFI